MRIRVLVIAAACVGSSISAAADPPKTDADTDFSSTIESAQAQMTEQMDSLIQATDTRRHRESAATQLTTLDPRFAVVIDRLALEIMATSGEAQQYADEVERGWFEGSFADFGRWSAVQALFEPVYGRYAAVVDNPPAYSQYTEFFQSIDAANADAELSGRVETCRDGAKPTDAEMQAWAQQLALYAEISTDLAIAFPERHVELMSGLGIWNQNTSTERSIVLSWVRRQLMTSHAYDPYSPDCPLQGTALDQLLKTKNSERVGPFFASSAPELVKGGVVPPETSSGD